jgi:DNA-binding IclR family transcriptional regulator
MRPVNHDVETRQIRLEAAEGARAVSKALALLSAFTPSRPWWTISELAALSSIPASTVTRLVSALEASGVLRRETRGFRYTIGHRVLTWASVARASTNLQTLAHPMLERLRDVTGESAAVLLRQGLNRVCLDVVQSNQEVHFAIPLGEIAPLTLGAASRCMAAYLSGDQQRALNLPSTELEQLEQIPQAGGLVCTISDRIKDAWALAAPIRDAEGTVIAALVVGGPTSRFNYHDVLQRYAPTLLEAARELSVMLGCPTDLLGNPPADFGRIPVFGSETPRTAARTTEGRQLLRS